MALSPVKAVLDARKNKDLGELDAIPFALIMNSQLGWTLYGVMLRDYYIFLSSCFPFMFGVILCMTAIHILERRPEQKEKKIRVRLETIMLTSMMFWMTIVFITSLVMGPDLSATATLIVGVASDVSSLVYYASPLSGIAEVIRLKDSASLYIPSIVISSLNCILWFFYGLLGVNSILIWLPNVIGLVICVVELVICFIYPASRKSFGAKLAQQSYEDLARITGEVSTRIRSLTVENVATRIRAMTVQEDQRARRQTLLPVHEEEGETNNAYEI
jgi:solute carrier family 50 protein (sugar transporter)